MLASSRGSGQTDRIDCSELESGSAGVEPGDSRSVDQGSGEAHKRKSEDNEYVGAALGQPPEHYDLAVKGVADIAQVNLSFTASRFPLTSVMELPFLAPDVKDSSNAFWQLYTKFPAVQQEFKDVKVVALFTNDPMQICTKSKPVRSLEDLKGMKIRVGDKVTAEAFKLLGANPIFMSITDVYFALDRGTIDGAMYTLEAVRGFKLAEVTKYCTVANFNCLRFAVVMNLAKWNSLPKDVQKLMGEELAGQYLVDLAVKGYEADSAGGLKALKDAGC